MYKLSGLALTLVLTLSICSTASAARKQFTDFSLDIPDGWSSEEHTDESGLKTVILIKGDTNAMIGLEPLEGKTLRHKVDAFAKQVNGKIEYLEDDTWSVTFTGDGGEKNCCAPFK